MATECDYVALFSIKVDTFIKEHPEDKIVVIVNTTVLECLKTSPNLMITTDKEYQYFYNDIPIVHKKSKMEDAYCEVITEEEYKKR